MANLNYKELGEGKPVIILHGLLGMLDNWRTFSKYLSESYRVISIDQRNHGKSFHSNEFNYQLLAEDLRQFMDEMEIDQAHLLGHSMGGKAVMEFLLHYEERVDKAVVVDISPQGSTGQHTSIFEALLSVDLDRVSSRKEVQDHLGQADFELSTILFLMKNLTRLKEGGYAWKANMSALFDNYNHILAKIAANQFSEKEVLFIKGEKSNYIKEEDMAAIGKLFPNYLFEEIKNAGHWVHADNQEDLLKVVRAFLS